MKIVVNIHCLHPPLTGVGHYARNILQILINHPHVDELVGVSDQGWHSQEDVKKILADPLGWENKLIEDSVLNRFIRFCKTLLRQVPGMLRLKYKLFPSTKNGFSTGCEDCIYWEPNYLPLPGVTNKIAITIHDLSHIHYPQFHPKERLLELQKLAKELDSADCVITVSDFTRLELHQYFDVSEAIVSVVRPAIEPRFSVQSQAVCDQVIKRYKLPSKFILFVGTIEPRKNLKNLVLAYNSLPIKIQMEYPLVIAGGLGWYVEELEKILESIENSNIVRLGYVDSLDLPALYSSATVFVYPSIYEGFGMPVLEAMACGTAVMTSNVASMPEVAEGAAALVDPHDVNEMAETIAILIAKSDLRKDMILRGLEVSKKYSWQDTTDSLIKAFLSLRS